MSARRILSWCLVFAAYVVTLFFSPLAHAAVGFQPVNPEELKMTSEPMAPGAPAVILYREVDRNDAGIFNQAGRFEEDYYRIKILTAEGRKYAEIEIPILESYIGVTGLHARTIRPDGSITEFNGQTFDKTVFKKKGYVKYKAKTFTLPDVQVGSILEYYYTISFEGWLIWDSHWILSQDLFQKDAKFSLRPFQEEGSHVNLRWSLHLPPGIPEPAQGPDSVVKMEVHNLPAFRTEDFMPPEDELKARVDFIYSYDAIDPDLNHFWKTAGKKRNSELENFISKHGALEDVVSQTIAPSDTPEVKLQKLYARVQQLRNTSYEVEKTDEQKKREKQKDLANAEEVLNRGYGTQDQLNWLFVGLARAIGLDAHGVAVSDRSEFFFDPQLMDASRLNQSAVLVKLDGKDLYFDPGSPFAPFGMLKWEETGVQGRLLDKDGGSWIQTTVPDSALSQTRRKAEFKLTDSGDLEGNVTVTFTGLESVRRRDDQRNEDEVARKKSIEDELKNSIPAASEVHLTNTPDWKNANTPLVAAFTVRVPGWVARGGNLALCPLGLFGAGERHIFDSTERTQPIYFDYPAQQVDDISIELPAGWKVTSLPKPINQDYRVVAYSIGAEDGKTRLELRRVLNINIISMDTTYYGAIRSFFQGVRIGDAQQAVLQPGTAVSSN